MAKCLFFNIPAFGHVSPTIPLVKELLARGIEVIYYNTEGFREIFEKEKIPFRSYPGFNPTTTGSKKIDNMTLLTKYMSASDSLTQFTLDEIKKEKPDFIIRDNLVFWAKIASYVSGIPTLTSNTTVAFNKQLRKLFPIKPNFFKLITNLFPFLGAMTKYNKLLKKYNYPKTKFIDFMLENDGKNLVFTSKLFQPMQETFKDNYFFVGPSINTPYEQKKRDTIYISMGTIFNKNTKFFNQCFEAFKDLPYRIVISLGKGLSDNHLQDNAPDNFVIYDFVNQKEILQECVLFVTHGGMNGTSEGLYFETPLLVLPQMGEQKMNGTRAEELGAAILLDPKKITAGQLKDSALKIINNPAFKENASKIRNSFVNSGGYKKAADVITNLFLKTPSPSPV